MSCAESRAAGRLLAMVLALAAALPKPDASPIPTRPRTSNPAIQLNQVEGPAATARGVVGVEDLGTRLGRGGLAVAPVQTARPLGPSTALTQPSATLDRCEAILQGRSPPIEGLDCSAGQLERLRQAAGPQSPTSNIDALSRELLGAPGGGPVDSALGAPAIVILTPGR